MKTYTTIDGKQFATIEEAFKHCRASNFGDTIIRSSSESLELELFVRAPQRCGTETQKRNYDLMELERLKR